MTLSKIANCAFDIIGVLCIVVLCILHFIIPQLYSSICCPRDLKGLIISPLKMFSFECKMLRDMFGYSVNSMYNLKIIAMTSISNKLMSIMKKQSIKS